MAPRTDHPKSDTEGTDKPPWPARALLGVAPCSACASRSQLNPSWVTRARGLGSGWAQIQCPPARFSSRICTPDRINLGASVSRLPIHWGRKSWRVGAWRLLETISFQLLCGGGNRGPERREGVPGFSRCLGAEWGTERSSWEWNVDKATKTERLSLTACPGLWNPGWGCMEDGPGWPRGIRPTSRGPGLLRSLI